MSFLRRCLLIILPGVLYGLSIVPASAQVKATNPLHCDINKDGIADILWKNMGTTNRSGTGDLFVWYMNGTDAPSTGQILRTVAPAADWEVIGCGDLLGDGNSDIIWYLPGGLTNSLAFWIMNGTTMTQGCIFTGGDYYTVGAWVPVLFNDMNGDGKLDVIWQHSGPYNQGYIAPSDYII